MAGPQDSKKFTLDKLEETQLASPISVFLPFNLSQADLLKFPAFKDWLAQLLHNLDLQKDPAHTFHSNPFKVQEIDVQSADWFGPKKLGFVKIQAKVQNDAYTDQDGNKKQDSLPGAVFLRGGSVGILVTHLQNSHLNKPLTIPSLYLRSTTKTTRKSVSSKRPS